MRLTSLLTAAVLTAAPVALTVLPASAATCTAPEVRTQVAPRSVVLDANGTVGFDVTVTVRPAGCTVGAVAAQVTSPTRSTTDLTLTAVETTAETTVYRAHLDLSAADLADADAGRWKVRTTTAWGADAAAAEDEDEDGDEAEVEVEGDGQVSVLAASRVTADATSTALRKGRIAKGKALTVRGALTRVGWESGTSTGYAKQRVEVQFRTAKGGYQKVKSVQTQQGGAFSTSVKAVKDGCYRVVYRGSRTTAPAPSAAECIDVR